MRNVDISYSSMEDVMFGQLAVLTGHGESVTCVTISPYGREILSGSQDYSIILWDLIRGKQVKSFVGHFDHITSVGFSSNS